MSQARLGKITHYNLTNRELRQSGLPLSTLLRVTHPIHLIIQSPEPCDRAANSTPFLPLVFNNLKTFNNINLSCLILE